MSMVTIINGKRVEVPREVTAGGVTALEAWHKKNNPGYKKGAKATPAAPASEQPSKEPEATDSPASPPPSTSKKEKGGKG